MSENCRKCAGRLVAAKLQTLTELARLARFERATAWFVALRAIVEFQQVARFLIGAYSGFDPRYINGLRVYFGAPTHPASSSRSTFSIPAR